MPRARANGIDIEYEEFGDPKVAPSRLERLPKVAVPTLVIHGLDDPLRPVENGRRVAAAIPGARLLELEGMGHNVPVRYWPKITDAVVETARRANVPQPHA